MAGPLILSLGPIKFISVQLLFLNGNVGASNPSCFYSRRIDEDRFLWLFFSDGYAVSPVEVQRIKGLTKYGK
jgi:hypothetical protein